MNIGERLIQRAEHSGYMKASHIRVTKAERDRGVAELTLQEDNLNPMGFAHGGVLYTMADCAAGAAAHSDGRAYVTQCSSFNFFRSGLPGDTIRAEAKVRRRGRSTCFVDLEIADSQGRLLCSGGFTYFCVGEDFEERIV